MSVAEDRAVRRLHYARTRERCHWCNVKMVRGPHSLKNGNPDAATREHLLPRSKGGRGNWDNLVYACLACNSRRSSDTDWVPWAEHKGNFHMCPLSQRTVLMMRLRAASTESKEG